VTDSTTWQPGEGRVQAFARNLVSRYVLMAALTLSGLIVLPLNIRYLGEADYGLWILVTSVTTYFSVLELGYGGAIVKFVAEYRARQDARALNEILSTMFYVFSAIGILVYLCAIGISFLLPTIFNLDPAQARTGQIVFLIVAANVALHFGFSVYGGVVNGFERFYLNNILGGFFNVAAAVVNVIMLWLGYGLVELVAATTLVRVLPYWIYKRNAHKVFPALQIRREYVRRDRLRELTSFSAVLAVIDWSGRLSYTTDPLVLGMFLNTAAVGVYAVAQRLSDALLRLTNQLHTFLFPAIVHLAVEGTIASQRRIMVKATRFQLAVSMTLCGLIAAAGDVLIRTWVGPGFEAAVVILQLLCGVVVVRTLMAMPATVLKATGHHNYVAVASGIAASSNFVLSIIGVNLFGMVGVALGTAIPSATMAFGFIFPQACRVVGLTAARGYREIVWPAVWPAVVVMALVAATRHNLPTSLPFVLAHLAVGSLIGAGLFFRFGLERDERQWFGAAVSQMTRGWTPPVPSTK
jgi:O-antigen/teichoic acid export membrane protein